MHLLLLMFLRPHKVLFSAGPTLTIKPLAPNSKPVVWSAHDGLVTCLDWSAATGRIVSGGEDCKYRC